MTAPHSLASVRIPVNEYHIGLRVRCVTADSFNTKRGEIRKIVHGNKPAFYVLLDSGRADELLYFAGNELEAEPLPPMTFTVTTRRERKQGGA